MRSAWRLRAPAPHRRATADEPITGQCTSSPGSWLALQQQRLRVFYELLYAHEEAHGVGAVHDAVVIRECKVHHWANLDLPVHRHRTVLDLVHPQYGYLRDI